MLPVPISSSTWLPLSTRFWFFFLIINTVVNLSIDVYIFPSFYKTGNVHVEDLSIRRVFKTLLLT